MQYAVLLYVDSTLDAGHEAAEWVESLPFHVAFADRLAEQGASIVAGGALHAATGATTLRVREGRDLITDGPFAETKEQLWGFYTVDAPDLDAVLAACRGLWEADHGSVEIRPLIPMPQVAPA